MRSPMRRLLIPAALFALGCGEDLDPGESTPEAPVESEIIDNGDGTFSVTVDATSETDWVYLDWDAGFVTAGADWDAAFQRFNIKLNGGVSGAGAAVAVYAADGSMSGRAPDEGWVADQPAPEGEAVPAYALADWYDYDGATHVLTPKPGVYFIRDAAGATYYAFRVDSYYDDVGTSGMVTITWGAVEAPENPPPVEGGEAPDPPEPDPPMPPDPPEPPADLVEVEAKDAMGWTYVRLAGDAIEVTSEDAAWDLAFQRSFIRTNGGSSGDGWAGAQIAADADYDTLAEAPTTGYVVDAIVPLPGPPGSGEASGSPVLNDWYNYNPMTHQLSPKDQVFLVRTHAGGYAKLLVWSYSDGTFGLRVGELEPSPAALPYAVEAPDWVYVNLRLGQSVMVEDPAEDQSWDVGIFGTRIRTNSGTSGAGNGGAYEVAVGASSGDAADCLPDEMLPEPGPPGSGEFSGSPALANWYDYNPMTHQVSPKDTAYVVCAADGTLAYLTVQAYADDTLSFEATYAGPGESTF